MARKTDAEYYNRSGFGIFGRVVIFGTLENQDG
jgi:hypothetical protein